MSEHHYMDPAKSSAASQRVNQTENTPEVANTPQDDILSLQRMIGNQALHRMLAGRQVQAKLHVGAANDPYEAEADNVAKQVMMMRDTPVQREAEEDELAMKRADVSRQEEDELAMKRADISRVEEDELAMKRADISRVEEDELAMKRADISRQEEDELAMKRADISRVEEGVDMMGAFDVGGDVESRINSSAGGGTSLDGGAREFLEPRFGQDFGEVRVHADSEANDLSNSIQAKAFTKGNDIYFADGQYQPESSAGRELLAHELTHVVQQTGGKKSS